MEIDMTPRRLQVFRLFKKDKIDQVHNLIDDEKWISCDHQLPEDTDVFLVKNGKIIFKAIYLHAYPNKLPSKWWDTKRDEYIPQDEITHWMEIEEKIGN